MGQNYTGVFFLLFAFAFLAFFREGNWESGVLETDKRTDGRYGTDG